MSKEYIYKTCVTIGDTNVLQNMYFVNHFKIVGKVRELWVRDCVKNFNDSLQGGLLLGTRRAACEYYHDYFLYDEIIVKMQFTQIKGVSTELLFKFYKNDSKDIYASSSQTIVFLNRSHELVRIPENFREAIEEYMVKND